MRKIFVNNEVYEVDRCLHCGEDSIVHVNANEPWNNEHWMCEKCDSTFAFNNQEIAIKS